MPITPTNSAWMYSSNGKNPLLKYEWSNKRIIYREKSVSSLGQTTILRENAGARVFVIDSTATPRYKIV